MREKHPVFELGDPESPIWRYFDFAKFVSLLDQKGLYFCRADLLGDPLEGSFTRAREAERQRLLANPPDGKTPEELERIFRHNAAVHERARWYTYVNCWHVGDHESMAMWQGYGGGPYGVAIRSTVALLDELLLEKSGTHPASHVLIGRVRYVDYSSESERIPLEHNLFASFVCKSVAYRHESELRAVFADMSVFLRGPDAPIGRVLPVDLQHLVQRVVVSPLSPPWFESLVGSVCEHFGLKFPVGRSIVRGAPVY